MSMTFEFENLGCIEYNLLKMENEKELDRIRMDNNSNHLSAYLDSLYINN